MKAVSVNEHSEELEHQGKDSSKIFLMGFQSSNKKKIILGVLVLVGIVLAFVIGYLVRRAVHKPKCPSLSAGTRSQGQSQAQREAIYKDVLKSLKAENLEKNLKYFSEKPHVAASPRNNELADEIIRRFDSYGFKSERFYYNILLSFPKNSTPNYAYILDNSNTVKHKTKKVEDRLEPSEETPDAVQPFNAFAPAGTVTGDLIYVNFGRYEDFQMLKNHFNMNCTGKIVIARYGKIFRGDKVKNAEANGAIGIMIYNDPKDYGPWPKDKLFPKSWWMPRDGVQRGSIGMGDGDVLTPGYPSTDDAYRVPQSETALPKIPSHPISAEDAYQFLSKLGGQAIGFSNWTGGFNFTYRIGPFDQTKYNGWKAKVEVHNERKIMRVLNVVGTLKGSVEPDRYVLIGNHRDAWVFGAADPGSGTTVMMEVARAIGEKTKSGWKPRRTLKFCSWGGEEHGIIGSAEWVEENVKLLQDRAVAYINLDTTVYGNYSFRAQGSPLIHDLVYKVTKEIQDPHDSKLTVYDQYLKVYPPPKNSAEKDPVNYTATCSVIIKKTGKQVRLATAKLNGASQPISMEYKMVHGFNQAVFKSIGSLGSGSDYYFFYQRVGVASIDFKYTMKQINSAYGTSFYPVYHSLHDTFYWMKHFVDPQFKCHLIVAKVSAYVALMMADSPLLPMNPVDYGTALIKGAADLKKQLAEKGGSAQGANTSYVEKATKAYVKVANEFDKVLKGLDKKKELQLRMINDQLMQLEKGFILPEGLPGRPLVKHLVFAPQLHNAYGSSAFAGVVDLLYDIDKTKNWGEVKKQLSFIATSIESVTLSLKNVL